MKCLMSPQETKDVDTLYLWPKGAGAWQMEVTEEQPFSVLSAAENGSEIANCNSLRAIECEKEQSKDQWRVSRNCNI